MTPAVRWTLAKPNVWIASGLGIAAIVAKPEGRWVLRVDFFDQTVATGDFDSAPDAKRTGSAYIRKILTAAQEQTRQVAAATKEVLTAKEHA